jgi:hypothetical protein
MHDLYKRTAARVQIATDGYYTYQPVPFLMRSDWTWTSPNSKSCLAITGNMTPPGGTPQVQS